MIGRADIEGSKSNVAMNCFAATSQLSLDQTSIYPSVPTRISVLVELHLRTTCDYLLNRCAAVSQTPHLTMSSAQIGPPKRSLGNQKEAVPPSDSRK
ncbi:hypothetical protein Tco_0851164 [Tanacetum coccineum]